MGEIYAGDHERMSELGRQSLLASTERAASYGAELHAKNLLRQAIVQVRELYPTAVGLRVQVGRCGYDDCGETHVRPIEVRDGDGAALWECDPADTEVEVGAGKAPWGEDKANRPAMVRSLLMGAYDYAESTFGPRTFTYEFGDTYELTFRF